MPKITFPKNKYDDYDRRLCIPLDKETIKKLSVGESISIKVTGKVKGLTERTYKEYPDSCCGPVSGRKKGEEPKESIKRELEVVLDTAEFAELSGTDEGIDEDLADA